MRIIPVIDLMGGLVVRGVGGRRDEYRPIESQIASEPTPEAVSSAFAERGFGEVYVADLDAIVGKEPSWNAYGEIINCGLKLWLDAGLTCDKLARKLSALPESGRKLHRIIVGLETVERIEQFDDLLQAIGRPRCAFSLDLKHGQPITSVRRWREKTALQIADEVLNFGIRSLIVLDLASVGEGQGVGTESLCRAIRQLDAKVELIAGGGVRGQHDLDSLEQAGCNAALVASALHDGRL